MIVRIETKLYRKTSSIVIPLRTGPDRITCSNYSSESIGIYEFDEGIVSSTHIFLCSDQRTCILN